ncbi:MAG: FlgD immunoglobulin-like domain containing protein, partial [Armatimonadota bacterium]
VTYVGMPAGSYTRPWDGKGNNGAIVPNGTYTVVIAGTTSSGAALTTATGTVSVSTGTTPAPSTPAFTVTSVSPTTIDPSKGATVLVKFSVPTAANVVVYMRNSAGTTVRNVGTFNNMAAGSYSETWNGKNDSSVIVPNGTYTMVISGKTTAGTTITPATGNVTVSTGGTTPPPPPPPPPTSTGAALGQTIDGAGSANFDWTKYSGVKFGVAFKAPKSGTIKMMTMQWKKSSGYGAGSYGKFDFELQSNGSGNYPSGSVIASARGVNPSTAMDGYTDGALHFNISANLTAGQIYHVVITNVDSNPSSNWSSPNTLMSSVQPWDSNMINGPRAMAYDNGRWSPWTSSANDWNTGGGNSVNGGHVPLMLSWTDGTITGDPFYSAAISGGAYFYGSNRAGEYINWNRPSVTITKVGVSVGKRGSPGSLIYHLEKVGSGDIASGTIATSSTVSSLPKMVYVSLPSAVTLTQGTSYRLWFESPSSSSSNCYYQWTVYGESRPAAWLEGSWGGTASYLIYGSGSWSSWVNSDLTFDLQ